MTTPMGPQSGTLTLVTDGSEMTGSISGPQGALDIEDGKIDGDELSWKLTVAQMNMTIEVKAKVDGDKMTGEADAGAMGKMALEGTRA